MSLLVGNAAPDFQVALQDSQTSLADFAGEVLLLVFLRHLL